jgi:hypothetical protein
MLLFVGGQVWRTHFSCSVCVDFHLFTNSIQLNPSPEDDSFLASHNVLHFYWIRMSITVFTRARHWFCPEISRRLYVWFRNVPFLCFSYKYTYIVRETVNASVCGRKVTFITFRSVWTITKVWGPSCRSEWSLYLVIHNIFCDKPFVNKIGKFEWYLGRSALPLWNKFPTFRREYLPPHQEILTRVLLLFLHVSRTVHKTDVTAISGSWLT